MYASWSIWLFFAKWKWRKSQRDQFLWTRQVLVNWSFKWGSAMYDLEPFLSSCKFSTCLQKKSRASDGLGWISYFCSSWSFMLNILGLEMGTYHGLAQFGVVSTQVFYGWCTLLSMTSHLLSMTDHLPVASCTSLFLRQPPTQSQCCLSGWLSEEVEGSTCTCWKWCVAVLLRRQGGNQERVCVHGIPVWAPHWTGPNHWTAFHANLNLGSN